MKCSRVLAIPVIALLTTAAVAAAPESPRVYTTEDLDKMFGPAPKRPTDPVDKSGPEDWRFVEQFLDRQYSRIDADRSHDLDRRTVDIAETRVAAVSPYRYGGVAWGLGYPANLWWQKVHAAYSGCSSEEQRRHGWGGRREPLTVNREPSRRRH